MLKVCIVVDVEGFISFKQGNPAWSSFEKFKGIINRIIKSFRYDKNGFEKIYNLALKEKLPVTFMLTGILFEPKKDSPEYIEFGYHSFSHKPLTFTSDSELKEEVKNIYSSKSFSAPMWMIEDIREPSRIFAMLKKEGYKTAVYRGQNEGIKSMQQNKISQPVKKYGIKCVYTSNWFDGERNFKIEQILDEIRQNCNKEAVYCITTHDFSNKNMNNFKKLSRRLKEMEEKKMIKLTVLKDV